MSLACQMHEKVEDYDACKDRYETIGDFFFAMNNFFEAAEAMSLAGEDISNCEVPVDADAYRTIQNKV